MQNKEIAKIFLEIAELLELKEGNRFKIRAYENAARNIENFEQNLEGIYKKSGLKGLEELEGVGESIAHKIEEFIKYKKIKKHQDLLKEFPKGFLALVDIPGMGPKTAMKLHKELNINSVTDLEKAVKKGLLKNLPGFKEKKQENIKKGIELKKKSRGRYLISEANEFADSLIKQLKNLKEADKIEVAGSLRRRQETIGDIDILVTAKKPEIVMDSFTQLPEVRRVLAKGETKSSVILNNNMQSDLRVLNPDEFGSALHYFTGNKQHNIKIRELAIKKGLKVSEYGLFKGDKKIAGKVEKELFDALGLQYIPPELRQGLEELETAKEGKIPKLIELSDIKGDLQMHSTHSDGKNTIKEMAEYAKNLGYSYIAITDHSISERIANGQSEKELFKAFDEIDKLNARLKEFKILKGVEVDILPDGSLDFSDDILKECDVVLAAVHSGFKMPQDKMTKRIIKALQNKDVNIMAHPTGRLINERDPYDVDVHEMLKAASDTGTFMEINAHPKRLDLKDVHIKIAKEMGILFAISTDSHATISLENMKYGVSMARRGWTTKNDVINTLPIDKLLKKLYSKR